LVLYNQLVLTFKQGGDLPGVGTKQVMTSINCKTTECICSNNLNILMAEVLKSRFPAQQLPLITAGRYGQQFD